MAPLLEREEVVAHARRGWERPVPALARVGEQLVERGVEPHLAELDAHLVGLEPGRGARELDHADRPLPALEEPQGALDLGGPSVCHRPRRRTSGSFAAASSASSWGVSSTSPIASRQVENDAIASAGEDAARRASGGSATRLTLMRLAVATHAPGQAHRDAELLQPWEPLAHESAHLRVVELDGARRITAKLDANALEDGCDQLQPELERAPRIALAQEREHLVAPVAQQARGERERGVVGRLEPQLEDDGAGGARSGSSRRRPRFHGARERRERPSSTHDASRRSSAG